MKPIEYNRRLLITGFGAVAHAALPMLLQHLRIPLHNITVIDISDRRDVLRPWIARGVRFVQERVTPMSLARLLATHVNRGGLIVDLAWSIDFFAIAEWARNNDVLYVNASLESWDPAAELQPKSLLEKTLYHRYARVVQMAPKWRDAATALLDQGANPGLISYFVKQGLLDIGARAAQEKDLTREQRGRLERCLSEQDFPDLARELGVKVIHCSERDTQHAERLKGHDEFVNTWSVEGLWEECVAPCELGWGSHEKSLPPRALKPRAGPRNQIILPQMGMNTWVRSWVPDQEIVGMAIAHGEIFGISHALTIQTDRKVLYRPTVLYAYLPSNDTMTSLHELRCRNYEPHPKKRIPTEDIVAGKDAMGALIMGHRYQSWWTGTRLSIEQARRKVPHGNATTVQVAAGLVAAIRWAIQNPKRGLCFPEDLPHEELLRHARPYLGRIVSQPQSWTPLMSNGLHFPENPDARPDRDDPWQFRHFLFRP